MCIAIVAANGVGMEGIEATAATAPEAGSSDIDGLRASPDPEILHDDAGALQ